MPFKPRTKEFIPTVIKLSREDLFYWGRILEIHPDSCRFLSQFEMFKDRIIALSFEINGAEIEDLRGNIQKTARDSEGYFVYEMFLTDETQKSKIRNILLDVLS
ncbi:MAG: hypothetical protein HY746_03820 [Elusimicrobia bacterium]|nr:hypothetical protein [Elusimicrobiota bacterium]